MIVQTDLQREVTEPSFDVDDVRARYSLLASAVAGRPVQVAVGPRAWTDGRTIYACTHHDIRAQVLCQAALLGSGSLGSEITRQLVGRPQIVRRYLAVEGRRVMAGLGLPPGVIEEVSAGAEIESGSPAASLELASSRARILEAPAWFGEIRPRQVLDDPEPENYLAPTARQLAQLAHAEVFEDAVDEEEEDDEQEGDESQILKLFQNPLSGDNPVSRILQKVLKLGTGPSQGGDSGGDPKIGQIRNGKMRGRNGVTIELAFRSVEETLVPSGAGFVYPEWDHGAQDYRPDWCTVLEDVPDAHAVGVLDRPSRHDALRRQLGRLGLGQQRTNRQTGGHDLDLDAVVAARVDVAAGQRPGEAVYVENLRRRRDLGVLVLLDASGSGTERPADGNSVFQLQREATAALVDTLSLLGDRVASYAFRSRGRSRVILTRIKGFDEPFGQQTMARLGGIEPSAFTRFGAAIRHSTHLLDTQSGVARRLLIVISDGFPYDDSYEGRYAQQDARRALLEARASGVGCLCINLASSTEASTLETVFGPSASVTAQSIDELAPRVLPLVHAALATADLQRHLAKIK